MAVRVSGSQFREMCTVLFETERKFHESTGQDFEHERHIVQEISRFSENRFTGQQGFGHLRGQFFRPSVVLVMGVQKGHEESGVRDAFHRLPKPSRVDRSRGPRALPASAIHGLSAVAERAFSNCCRTTSPWVKPVLSAVCLTHWESSFGNRTLSVLLIRQKCMTSNWKGNYTFTQPLLRLLWRMASQSFTSW